MNLELPAGIERELERFAQTEQVSPAEAAVKLIRSGLKASQGKPSKKEITDEEWRQLIAIPIVSFFQGLPDSSIDSIETVSKRIRSEKVNQRE